MQKISRISLLAFILPTDSIAHPSLTEHSHPHQDAASYFTVETLLIFLLGLSIGGIIAFVRRKRQMNEQDENSQ